jgi:hypothetical protein
VSPTPNSTSAPVLGVVVETPATELVRLLVVLVLSPAVPPVVDELDVDVVVDVPDEPPVVVVTVLVVGVVVVVLVVRVVVLVVVEPTVVVVLLVVGVVAVVVVLVVGVVVVVVVGVVVVVLLVVPVVVVEVVGVVVVVLVVRVVVLVVLEPTVVVVVEVFDDDVVTDDVLEAVVVVLTGVPGHASDSLKSAVPLPITFDVDASSSVDPAGDSTKAASSPPFSGWLNFAAGWEPVSKTAVKSLVVPSKSQPASLGRSKCQRSMFGFSSASSSWH